MTEPNRQPWTLIGPGLSAMLAPYQFALLLGPLRSALQHDFGLSNTTLAVVVATHLLAVVMGLAPGYFLGRLAPTSVVVSGLVLMLIGAVGAALSGSSIVFIAAGLVAGFGEGAVIGAAAGLTGQVSQKRGLVRLGLGIAVLCGLVVGSVLGWLLSDMLSWRTAYLVAVPLTLIALFATTVGGVVTLMRRSKS